MEGFYTNGYGLYRVARLLDSCATVRFSRRPQYFFLSRQLVKSTQYMNVIYIFIYIFIYFYKLYIFINYKEQ